VSDLGAVCGSAWQHEPAVRLRRAHGQSDPRPAAVRLRGAVVPGARAHVPADPAQVPRGLRVRRHRLRRLALHDRHVERVQLGAGPLAAHPRLRGRVHALRGQLPGGGRRRARGAAGAPPGGQRGPHRGEDQGPPEDVFGGRVTDEADACCVRSSRLDGNLAERPRCIRHRRGEAGQGAAGALVGAQADQAGGYEPAVPTGKPALPQHCSQKNLFSRQLFCFLDIVKKKFLSQ